MTTTTTTPPRVSERDIMNATTPSRLLALAKSAIMVSGKQGDCLDAYFDDHSTDTRLVITYRLSHSQFTLTILSGYNAEKHCWERQDRRSRIEITSKHGTKDLNTFLGDMSELGHVWRHCFFSVYRSDTHAKGWKVY